MPHFNVHLYREARCLIENVEAKDHKEAARIAATKPAEDFLYMDCEGETFSALVDVVGDENFTQSRMVDFPKHENLKKLLQKAYYLIEGEFPESDEIAAPVLLQLREAIADLEGNVDG